ncbi:hypothetical protein FB381_0311 [Nocardioides albertanoniae]|uniref:Uncharacterized protein n=1 Tax=Nocardioides albertanoniae TaxID=1175486 RepID=A0A543A1J5_9ACTN|nr:hypothetical protein [Nocardioides albertanoniae]TQL66452.1 hypothetical protein FB381_0311 [Nocardioides albertanoniae]
MDRAPRRRADKSKRGRRAAGRSEPTPAYVEPTSSEALAYDQWAENDWSSYQETGWDDEAWYDDHQSPQETPAPGGGRRIAGGAQPEPQRPEPRRPEPRRPEPRRPEPRQPQSREPQAPGYSGRRAARSAPPAPEETYGGYPEPAPALSSQRTPAYSSQGPYAGSPGFAQAPHQTQQPAYQPDPYQADPYQADAYQADPYQPDAYQRDPYQADPYQSDRFEPVGAEPAVDPNGDYGPQPTRRGATAAKVTAFLAQPRVPSAARAGLGIIESLTAGTVRVIWVAALVVGLAGLAISAFDLGPQIFGSLGAAVVGTAYTFALAHRTGGRPLIFGLLAAVAGLVVVVTDNEALRTGASVLVASVAAVLAVMATVPGRRFLQVTREAFIAVGIAAVGSFAALGFEPVVTVSRFEYATLACALAVAFFAVYRLGAGLHGLGRRGAIVVGIGGLMLALTLIYAEMLRRYGSTGLLDSVDDIQHWCRLHIGGYPHPIQALFGVPALVWGTHMRARRRQGWWVCLFGVTLTAPVASTFLNPDIGLAEAGLSVIYSIAVGLVLAFIIIRIDLAFTGSQAAGGGRRAAREIDESSAVRPEPSRTRALL